MKRRTGTMRARVDSQHHKNDYELDLNVSHMLWLIANQEETRIALWVSGHPTSKTKKMDMHATSMQE